MVQTGMQELRIVDNFYQTSSYFPMPTILIGTLSQDGSTTFGAYSLCFPFYVAGKDYYAMMLNCRNSSNTCRNLLRDGRATLNFIPAKKRILREVVRLGFPGEESNEKMKKFRMTMRDGRRQAERPDERFPKVIEEAFQVFECTWIKDADGAEQDVEQETYAPPYHNYNGITSEFGAHFLLRIDKILMPKKYRRAIVRGVTQGDFPPIPVDYGYRDSKNFWLASGRAPCAETVKGRAVNVDTVVYAANRIDPSVKFTRDACKRLVKVPRVFLNSALKGCVDWAKAHKVEMITEREMTMIRDKRAEEKKK